MNVQFELNGRLVQTEHEPGTTLMELLRSRELYSVKHGCDHGECGACTVLMDSKSVNACLILVHTVSGRKIETLESFSDHKTMHHIQDNFLHEGAAQCGYCTPGMILAVEALKREGGEIDEPGVRDALNGNLCRCTGYVKPVKAGLSTTKASRDKENAGGDS
ncbi:MAG: (2Fe-2S)-binding protein [Candidatus Marinimicrobia bacterium]|jgi:aerobic-type carbon monoxide dehydrogenase small subunit (CoxS/CutS family)|nr:(2Fe-2S)-binding protein [Candidatus Neomarinimicrobiota bacterium]MBT4361844.1 (2Fe-2S)-binding protein [Candidatus Neomarinimicrobiota bacterium]MBT4714400.1 (2Fe-2S)-binding protein [Candidatus Neomarinimicrobiota bacterium]MBT4946101.1 (2Fe-2S)-binding protein [Candidatus Neomarinimicrobiota bacterium]MBT5268900.1 (2Fe-2S)-binding protein [Candidatus Neomarinimicrobiota bacterium]